MGTGKNACSDSHLTHFIVAFSRFLFTRQLPNFAHFFFAHLGAPCRKRKAVFRVPFPAPLCHPKSSGSPNAALETAWMARRFFSLGAREGINPLGARQWAAYQTQTGRRIAARLPAEGFFIGAGMGAKKSRIDTFTRAAPSVKEVGARFGDVKRPIWGANISKEELRCLVFVSGQLPASLTAICHSMG